MSEPCWPEEGLIDLSGLPSSGKILGLNVGRIERIGIRRMDVLILATKWPGSSSSRKEEVLRLVDYTLSEA